MPFLRVTVDGTTVATVDTKARDIVTVRVGGSRDDDDFADLSVTGGIYDHDPGETAEVPVNDDEPCCSVAFDEFFKPGVPFQIGRRRHGLLLVIEVHAGELVFAREHGTPALLARLKEAGHYPRCDLDRDSVAGS